METAAAKLIRAVIGSRSVARAPDLQTRVRSELWGLTMHADCLVTSDSRGVDATVRDEARLRRAVCWTFSRSGLIESGDPDETDVTPYRWTRAAPPARDAGRDAWEAWRILRDRSLAWALYRAAVRGARVQVLGLVDPWSETYGTDYTLGCCRVLGARPLAQGRLSVHRQELPRFGATIA